MPFQLFGTAHLLALSVIVALALGVPLLPRRRSPGIVPPLA
jgi:energy-converting hydrogenase Eha subunit A